jgi:hypothetical protein
MPCMLLYSGRCPKGSTECLNEHMKRKYETHQN